MLCDNCGKREAVIHIQKIVNGKVEVKHYCNVCAEKLSGTEEFDGMDFVKLLSSLTGHIKGAVGSALDPESDSFMFGENAQRLEEYKKITCPVCSWDLAQFLKSDLCGCPACYEAFSKYVEKIIRKTHKGTVHMGSVPPAVQQNGEMVKRRSLRKKMEELQREMDFMVEKEEYEIAARLRDELNSLRSQLTEDDPEALHHGK